MIDLANEILEVRNKICNTFPERNEKLDSILSETNGWILYRDQFCKVYEYFYGKSDNLKTIIRGINAKNGGVVSELDNLPSYDKIKSRLVSSALQRREEYLDIEADIIKCNFITDNPKLALLSPKVVVNHTLGDEYDGTIVFKHTSLSITVFHPFIFDNRLVPSSYKGIEVQNVTIGKYPKEFPDFEKRMMPLYIAFNPQYYINFVYNNINLLKTKLNNPNLSKQEALDALTGNFKKHIEDCMKWEQNVDESTPEILKFYSDLLDKTESAYNISEIKKQRLAYSVTATQIIKNRPLIVGFNWGVDNDYLQKGNEYLPQSVSEYPKNLFVTNYDDLGSLKRTVPYFENYFPKALTGMQSNFCFFRSKKEEDISDKDLNLGKNLFEELLEFSNPSILISFSSKLRDHLLQKQYLYNISKTEISFNKGTLSIIKAHYKLKSGIEIPFVYLPHPNSPIKKIERKKAWDFCFGSID